MGGTYQKVSPLDGAGNKGVAELNLDTRNEHKEVRDVFAGEGQGLSDEDEYRINDVAMDLNEAHVLETAVVSHIPVLEKLQHQSPAPIVRWDRFLPLRTLKVLLVENDDSTRQVVSALLRNCCYEVTAVANGLDAWRVLQNLTNHIDLVLTEVVMPGWSGIGLLCKIMSHKTCKTIPVIMMSSNDSMGIVFKCLSKGAVDFLVKPIRKNELKNLWQHVWRRCHSSSGSGSESGIEGQKFTKSKSEEDSDNNSGSNDEDNGSIGLSARDGSDNGSGTQGSWTKRAFEADSPQPMSPSEQLASPHDSTCAHVIHPKPEALICSKNVPMNAGADRKEQNKITDDFMGTDLSDESYQTDKFSTKLTGPSTEKFPENAPSNIDVVRSMNYNTLNEPSVRAPDQRGSSSINTNQQSVLRPPDTSKDFLKISENKDNGYVELPSLELSLKRLRSNSIPSNDERNVLKHSNLSAFSRYPASAVSFQAPTYGANSALNNSSEATPQHHGSNGSSSNTNNNDKRSTNINVVTKPGIYKEASTSSFHPVRSQSSTIQPIMQEKIDEIAAAAAAAPAIGESRGSQKQVQVQHHHHHHHHYHHHVHALQPQPDQDGLSVDNMNANVTYCNSSNVFTISAEANATNCSLNGSNSGSNHGSDGQNGCSNAGGTNMESAAAIGITEKSGVGGGNGSGGGGGNGAYQNRFTQREAALNKFRQKRKERNFGKKVRYQSRKRLAEQRPRVRGQFVRRIIHDENHEEEES